MLKVLMDLGIAVQIKIATILNFQCYKINTIYRDNLNIYFEAKIN